MADRRSLVFVGFVCIFLIGLVLGLAISVSLETKRDVRQFIAALDRFNNINDPDQRAIAVVDKVGPAVVSIIVSKDIKEVASLSGPEALPFDPFGLPDDFELPIEGQQRVAVGSGFVVNSAKGLIVTNKHVVNDDQASYTVVTSTGEKIAAEVMDVDAFSDLAVIKIDNELNIPEVILGDSDQVEVGQTIIAIGYSLGEYTNTVTKGVVSGMNRRVVTGSALHNEVIDGAMQIDAAINPGNSGGPLINLAGEVIGINTAINRSGQSVGFAIPVNAAKEVLDSFDEHGRIRRPWLGIRYKMIKNDEAKSVFVYGALIVPSPADSLSIIPDTPAARADLREGDIIFEIDGRSFVKEDNLGNIIKLYQPGDTVLLRVLRDDEIKIISVKLGEFAQEYR